MKRDSEAAFQRQIENLAGFYGWHLQYHTFDSRRSHAGWPDLVLCRPPEILFLELKAEKTRVRPEQLEWIEALTACGLEAGIFRPTDFDELHARLARGRRRTEPLYRESVT